MLTRLLFYQKLFAADFAAKPGEQIHMNTIFISSAAAQTGDFIAYTSAGDDVSDRAMACFQYLLPRWFYLLNLHLATVHELQAVKSCVVP